MIYKTIFGCLAIVSLCLVSFWIGRRQSINNNDGEAEKHPGYGYSDPRREDVLLGHVFGKYIDTYRNTFPSVTYKAPPTGVIIESAAKQNWTREEKLRFIFFSLITMRLDGEGYSELKLFAGDDSEFISESINQIDRDDLVKCLMLSADQLQYIQNFVEFLCE